MYTCELHAISIIYFVILLHSDGRRCEIWLRFVRCMVRQTRWHTFGLCIYLTLSIAIGYSVELRTALIGSLIH